MTSTTSTTHHSVFDVHIHVQPWEMMKPSVLALMDDEAHRGVKATLESPEALLRELDANGVERACCINYVAPDVMGFTSAVNPWIANFTKSHRDRLLPVGSVNPLHSGDVRGDAQRMLDLGIRMVKIHPPHQLFSPNAYRFELPGLAELYEECDKAAVPIMFHTGTSVFPGARNVYADPMAIDDVAVDFPNIPIILAHAGRPLYGETAFFLARRHPNIHIDLSGIPPLKIPQYLPRFEQIVDRLLWGTDWPSPGVVSMKKNIEQFESLELSDESKRKVLYGNATAIFG